MTVLYLFMGHKWARHTWGAAYGDQVDGYVEFITCVRCGKVKVGVGGKEPLK